MRLVSILIMSLQAADRVSVTVMVPSERQVRMKKIPYKVIKGA